MTLIAFPLLMTVAAGGQTWQASQEQVQSFTEKRRDILYDEGKVPSCTLPDPLVMGDGNPVASASDWREKRRPEILELFENHVYGRPPVERPKKLSWEVFDEAEDALGGKAKRKQIQISVRNRKKESHWDLLLYLPAKAKEPVPVFLLLNFKGNHTIQPDPAIRLPVSWMRENDGKALDKDRGIRGSRFPVEAILSRGYGLATVYYGDIDPDFHDHFENGVHGVFDEGKKGERAGDAWGSIGAWAWGLSRVLDCLQETEGVDRDKVCVLGHSRLGKTSLWAGARDERFALVISNNSGCGGAALSRRCFGETVERINRTFPHWFCREFHRYNKKEEELPVDQHMLLSLIAPRPLYVASADRDLWADPRGEFLSALGAHPVYQLLGQDGLPVPEMPPLDTPAHGTIGYHIRSGGHDLSEYDWHRFMDFADSHFR